MSNSIPMSDLESPSSQADSDLTAEQQTPLLSPLETQLYATQGFEFTDTPKGLTHKKTLLGKLKMEPRNVPWEDSDPLASDSEDEQQPTDHGPLSDEKHELGAVSEVEDIASAMSEGEQDDLASKPTSHIAGGDGSTTPAQVPLSKKGSSHPPVVLPVALMKRTSGPISPPRAFSSVSDDRAKPISKRPSIDSLQSVKIRRLGDLVERVAGPVTRPRSSWNRQTSVHQRMSIETTPAEKDLRNEISALLDCEMAVNPKEKLKGISQLLALNHKKSSEQRTVDATEGAATLTPEQLFDLVDKEDCDGLVHALEKYNQPLHKIVCGMMCDQLNVLHHALFHKKVDSAWVMLNLPYCKSEAVLAPIRRPADNPITCLHQAIICKSLELVKAIIMKVPRSQIDRYLHIESAIRSGKYRRMLSALPLAAMLGCTDICEYLVKERKVNVNLKINNGCTSLLLAARESHTDTVKKLKELGADVTLKDHSGLTAVHYAVRSKCINTAKVLLEYCTSDTPKGVRARCLDDWKVENPLVYCISSSTADMLKLLLTYPCFSETLINHPTEAYGFTPLHTVTTTGRASRIPQHILMFKPLLNAVANCPPIQMLSKPIGKPEPNKSRPAISRRATRDISNLSEKLEKTTLLSPLELRNKAGQTVIMSALASGEPSILRALFAAHHETNGKFMKYNPRVWTSVEEEDLKGWTALHYAVNSTSESSNVMLLTYIEILKRAFRDSGQTDSSVLDFFVINKGTTDVTTALHIAARFNKVYAIKTLCQEGFPENILNGRDETYLHVAAKYGQKEVLEMFACDSDVVDAKDKRGNTALHTAILNCNKECIAALLPFCDIASHNCNGRPALHELCFLKEVPFDLVKDLITRMKDISYTDLYLTDMDDNTALHVLAGRIIPNAMEIFELFKIDYDKHNLLSMRNKQGNTPLHLAVIGGHATNNLELLLECFPSAEVNQANGKNKTPIFYAVLGMQEQQVAILLQKGADLLALDWKDMTPLHKLVQQAIKYPAKLTAYRRILDTILENIVIWFCKIQKIKLIPTALEMERYSQLFRHATLFLFTGEHSPKHPSILSYAARHGATDVLAYILNIRGAFCMDSPNKSQCIRYYVTDFVPNTFNKFPCNMDIEKLYGYDSSQDGLPCYTRRRDVWKETIVRREFLITSLLHRDNKHGCKGLDIPCVDAITVNYWQPYKWMYNMMLLMHLAYMAVLSFYEVVEVDEKLVGNITTTSSPNVRCRIMPDFPATGLFLVWPLLLLAGNLTYLIRYIHNRILLKRRFEDTIGKLKNYSSTYIEATSFWFCGIVFAICIVVWYILFQRTEEKCHGKIVLAVGLVFGWIYSVHLTQGYRSVHKYSLVLQRMLFQDVAKFLVLFLFIILGFTMAFHILISDIDELRLYDKSVFSTVFLLFSMAVGMANLFDNKFNMEGDPMKTLIMVVYIMFVVLLNILLINMLIAIMNDSYSDVTKKHQLEWRVMTLKRGLQMEHQFPFIAQLLRSRRNRDVYIEYFDDPDNDKSLQRLFYIELKAGSLQSEEVPVLVTLVQKVHQLEVKLEDIGAKIRSREDTPPKQAAFSLPRDESVDKM